MQPSFPLRITALVAIAVLCACQGPPDSGPASLDGSSPSAAASPWTPTSGTAGAGETAGSGPSAAEASTPPTADQLAPVIQPWGREGELPQKILIDFARPVAAVEQIGQAAPGGTRLHLTPNLPGSLIITGPSQLTFTPQSPFPFATRIAVRLEAVETAHGVLRAPDGTGWTTHIETPAFRFLRMATRQIEYARTAVTVSLEFSGPVTPEQVRRALRFDLGSSRAVPFDLTPGSDAHSVTARLNSPSVRPSAALQLNLAKGVSASNDASARAEQATASVTLPDGKPVTLHAAHLTEADDGFYIDVICDDPSSGGRRYHYDRVRHNSYSVSRRCQLTEQDAQQFIRFDPPVAFQVSPGSGGFRLLGDFKRGDLTLTIAAGAVTVDGGVLMHAYEETLVVPAKSPKLRFSSNGRYLPRSAWRSLALQHTNVDEVAVSIRQVPPENLVFWLTQPSSERADERTSDLLLSTTIPVKNPPDTSHTTWVDLASLLPATTRGVLEVTAQGGSVHATSRLLLTNLSLVAKKSTPFPDAPWKQEVFVWALDIETAAPASGVRLDLKRMSGKTVGHCTTDRTGGCLLRVSDTKDEDKTPPFVIVAQKGNDLTYIRYADLKTDTSGFDVAGEPYVSERVYRAALWSDRGVYRPGETAHLAGLVRDRDNVAPKEGLPVDLKLIDPRGQVVKQLQLRTNAAGMFEQAFPFASFVDTGRYRVDLEVAKKPVSTWAFNVEEFVPERMKVEARAVESAYSLGQKASIGVNAQYLFGGSAEGSRVSVNCRLESSVFRPANNGQYQYGVFREDGKDQKPLVLGAVEGTLNANGQAALECPELGGPGTFSGPARLVASADVFEAGSGRSTHAETSVPVHPDRFYVGLLADTDTFKVNTPFKVEGVVVDWNGALLPKALTTVDLEFLRMEPEYGYYWDDEDGTESYRRYLRPVVDRRATVKVVEGRFSLEHRPTGYGAAYVVRVKSGGAQTDLRLNGDESAWWWWGDQREVDQTPKPLKPSTVALKLPETVRVGQQAKVTFRSPFKGRALLTVEADRVLTHQWLDVPAGDVTWSFTVDRFVPNVYVSAFVVKDPHLESKESFLPDRAFGVGTSRVAPVEFEQALTLEVPSEVRSNSKLEVKLDFGSLEGPTWATVAVVDEGVLSLTGFKSPNPFEAIFTRRALGVETYETIGWTLLMPPRGNQSRTGGDEASEDGPGRVQPIKPVALWSGLVEVPANGKLTLPFDIPQYRGRLRVMAVASGHKRMARAAASVVVRDPLVLQTTLPRFVLHGDVMQIPVFVTNTSGKPVDVKVSLTAEPLPVGGALAFTSTTPPLAFLGKSAGTARLENGKSATLVFQARAQMTVGAAKLRVRAEGGGFTSHEELDVPFLPNGPHERQVQTLELANGTVDLKKHLQGWVPTSERSTFWVTANPYGESFDHLAYLVRYPYGCIEQTTSSTRPLLFVSNLLQKVDPTLLANAKVEDMVMHGVNRVLSMQTPSGGFGYWLGHTEPTSWGTAYATHMLLDAQKAGYAVPQERLDRVLAWIQLETTRYENGRSAEYGDHGWNSDAESYMHFILAIAGKGNKARVLRLIEERQKNPRNADAGLVAEELYMLKAALYLSGDRRFERDLRHPDVSPIQPVRHNSWSFYSDLRRRGFILSTFQDLFGSAPGSEALARRIADALKQKKSHGYTTQELVWGVTGLGKHVAEGSKNFEVGGLFANGKALKAKADPKSADRTWSLYRASEYDSLQLEVKDTGKGKAFLVLSSEGVRKDGKWRIGGQGLSVSRRYRTMDGTEIDPGAGLDLADLAFVEIEIANKTGDRIQNIALVDRLPAGWEIENPRLGRGTPVSWYDASSAWKSDAMNVRDDRLEVFGALAAGETRTLVYAVRAVTAGTFTLPPIEVGAMYDPDLWARQPGGKVVVRGSWKDFLL